MAPKCLTFLISDNTQSKASKNLSKRRAPEQAQTESRSFLQRSSGIESPIAESRWASSFRFPFFVERRLFMC